MADVKISELTPTTTPGADALIEVTTDPGGTPTTASTSIADILALAGGGADLSGLWVSPTISSVRRPLWPLGFHNHSTTALGWQNVVAYDFWLPQEAVLTAMWCELTEAGDGGATSMMGVHEVDDAGVVGDRVTYQAISSASTGVKIATDGTTLPVGRYCVWFRVGPGGVTIRAVVGRFGPQPAGSDSSLNGVLKRHGGNWADNTNPIEDDWTGFDFENASDQIQFVALVLDRP